MNDKLLPKVHTFLSINDNELARFIFLLIILFVPYGMLKLIYNTSIIDVGYPILSILITLFVYASPFIIYSLFIESYFSDNPTELPKTEGKKLKGKLLAIFFLAIFLFYGSLISTIILVGFFNFLGISFMNPIISIYIIGGGATIVCILPDKK